MKKLVLTLALALAATALIADEGHHGKSCDMDHGGKSVELTGKIACKDKDDCTFRSTDAKTNIKVCEMSKVDVSKLSASGAAVTVQGKVVKC
jgi:hypothetical protein